jgi:hypothetical protein
VVRLLVWAARTGEGADAVLAADGVGTVAKALAATAEGLNQVGDHTSALGVSDTGAKNGTCMCSAPYRTPGGTCRSTRPRSSSSKGRCR